MSSRLIVKIGFLVMGAMLSIVACTSSMDATSDPSYVATVSALATAQVESFQRNEDAADSLFTRISCPNCELVDLIAIFDANTVLTSIGRVRLFGSSAPASNDQCHHESGEYFRGIVSPQVRIKYGPPLNDEYNTQRAYLFDSLGNSIDEQLIDSGFALADVRENGQLPGTYQNELVSIERLARNGSTGCLWKDFVPPTASPTSTSVPVSATPVEATATITAVSTPTQQAPSPTAISSPTPLPEPTIPPVPTEVPIATAVPTEEPTPEPTQQPTPSPTQEPTPTSTATPVPTVIVPTQTPTPVPVVPTPESRISISPGSTPSGLRFQNIFLDGARVIFSEPVGVISVSVVWGDSNNSLEVAVNQETGLISGSHAYSSRGIFKVTITAVTDQGDTATASINALVN